MLISIWREYTVLDLMWFLSSLALYVCMPWMNSNCHAVLFLNLLIVFGFLSLIFLRFGEISSHNVICRKLTKEERRVFSLSYCSLAYSMWNCNVQMSGMMQASSAQSWLGSQGSSSGLIVKRTIRVDIPVEQFPNVLILLQ